MILIRQMWHLQNVTAVEVPQAILLEFMNQFVASDQKTWKERVAGTLMRKQQRGKCVPVRQSPGVCTAFQARCAVVCPCQASRCDQTLSEWLRWLQEVMEGETDMNKELVTSFMAVVRSIPPCVNVPFQNSPTGILFANSITGSWLCIMSAHFCCSASLQLGDFCLQNTFPEAFHKYRRLDDLPAGSPGVFCTAAALKAASSRWWNWREDCGNPSAEHKLIFSYTKTTCAQHVSPRVSVFLKKGIAS